jgi:hypothetical protein
MPKKMEVIPTKPGFKINIANDIISLGSCFSDEISHYLLKRSVEICSNPFGTIYNCHSIFRTIEMIAGCKKISKEDLIMQDGMFISLDHATKFDSPDIGDVMGRINGCVEKYSGLFNKARVYMITPGTSIVYHFKKDGRIAANCHKLPADLFERRMMSVEENTKLLNRIISLIKKNNPAAKIVFTLSPIRHTPHDPVENNHSKSILRTSIGNVINDDDIVYFPSYEILFDELRDYSNYRKDGVHLKEKAVIKIAGKFVDSYFEKDYLAYMNEFENCQKFLSHKPHDPHSSAYIDMLEKTMTRLISLNNLKTSSVIEKKIVITMKRMLKYGGMINDRDILLLPEGKFRNFLSVFLNVYAKRTDSMNEKDLEYENRHFKKLSILKRHILATYYYHKGEYEMSSKIILQDAQ